MNQPQVEPTNPAPAAGPAPLAGRDRTKARWKQSLGAAKLAWGKLTDDELLQIEGRADRHPEGAAGVEGGGHHEGDFLDLAGLFHVES